MVLSVRVASRDVRSSAARRCAVMSGFLLVSVLVLVTVFAGTALATYSGSAAASYADRYALAGNMAYPGYGTDCTNFVSQAVRAGGYPFRHVGNYSATNAWWCDNSGWPLSWWCSNSWAAALNYKNFLTADIPGGIYYGWDWGNSNSQYTPSGVVTGDVLFYDFGQGKGISHSAIQVGTGTCRYGGGYGNIVDTHSNPRLHEIWTLQPNNAYAVDTKIYFYHISSLN